MKLRETAGVFDLVERLATYVEDGVLEGVQASSPLQELRRDVPLQSNYFCSVRCTSCGREFQLMMDTNRGVGDWF
jgi:hypothetical protein